MIVVVQSYQSIMDLALQYYGTVEAVKWLKEDNVITEQILAPGTEVVLRDIAELTLENVEVARVIGAVSTANEAPVVSSGYVDVDYVDDNYVE